MKIYEYNNYEEYVKIQTQHNKSKLQMNQSYFNTPGPRKGIIICMIENLLGKKVNDKDVMCHGTRDGHEQKFFKELFPKGHIQGTEISDTASKFPMTVQYDMSKQHPRWINRFDIVYSNSFDHSIDPKETLRVWHEQLREGGLLFIEWSESQSICDEVDPLSATYKEIEKIVSEAGFLMYEKHEIGKMQGWMYIFKRK